MRLNLQNKFMLPILATLLAFMGGNAFFLSHILVQRLEDHSCEVLQASNLALVKNIKTLVANYKINVRSVATMPPLRRIAEYYSKGILPPGSSKEMCITQLQDFLVSLPSSFPEFVQFDAIAPDGMTIASSDEKVVGNITDSDKVYFTSAIEGHVTISPFMNNPRCVGEKAVIITAPIYGFSGKIGGVLSVVLPCRSLIADTVEGITIGKTGYAYLVDSNSGLMLAHNVFEKVLTMDMFHYQPWMRNLKDGETGIKADYRDSQGNRRLAVYCKEPVSQWIGVTCLAIEELEDQAALIRNSILVCTLGGALLVAFTLIIVVRSVTRDILETNRFAQAVASGKLDTTLHVKRDDEIGALGDAMRQMVVSIKRMMQISAEEAQERELNLTIMRDAIMLTLANLVESRDLSTGQHIRKTATYVRIIVEELKREGVFTNTLTDEFVENIIKAAPLHDIGKINVPDAILNKPGRLTDEEFAIMKTHAAVGGQIIEHIINIVPVPQYLVEAKDLAMYHHEKWSGGGYPEGLIGDDIPLSARIMAVADVFDALVSDRAYKKGFPLDKAFAIIQEESGTHFDPRIVQAFFAAKDEIIRTEEEFKSEGANA